MKVLIGLLLIFSFDLFGKIPESLPNFKNINPILFREAKDYMFQVISKSELFEFDNNCRVYKFSGNNSVKELSFCLTNTESAGIITQDLFVQVDNFPAGSFKLIHEGKKPLALSFEEFVNFQIRPPKKGEKISFFFSHSTFQMVIDRRAAFETLKASMQLDDFKIEITEGGLQNNRFRNYLLSCSNCEGITWLKVQENGELLRYFSGANPSEVTPAHFNQFLNYFIILPFTQLGSQFKDALVFELNWPNLN